MYFLSPDFAILINLVYLFSTVFSIIFVLMWNLFLRFGFVFIHFYILLSIKETKKCHSVLFDKKNCAMRTPRHTPRHAHHTHSLHHINERESVAYIINSIQNYSVFLCTLSITISLQCTRTFILELLIFIFQIQSI